MASLRDAAVPRSSPLGRNTRKDRRRWLSVWLALVIGLCASASLGVTWTHKVADEHQKSFDVEAGGITSALGTALVSDFNFVRFQMSLVTSVPSLTNGQLANIYRQINLRKRFPGGIGIGYVERVSNADLAAFEASVLADPPINQPIGSTYAVFPSGDRSQYCLIRFGIATTELVTPTADFCSATLPGIGKSPIPDVLNVAMVSARPTVLSLASVVREMPKALRAGLGAGGSSGSVDLSTIFVVVLPVYRGGSTPATVAERNHQLIGWVFGTFSGQTLLGSALASSQGIGVSLFHVQSGGQRLTVASTGGHTRGSVHLSAVSGEPGWFIRVVGGPGSSAGFQGLLVGGLGAAISVLLFLLLVHVARSRDRALSLVEERTAELVHQTLHDDLTGLPNRTLVYDRAQRMLDRTLQDPRPIAALFIDLDNFKDINDTFGHVVGDKLIQAVAERLAHTVRSADAVGRLGGDEFVILMEGEALDSGPSAVADRIREALSRPFEVPGPEPLSLAVHASIGVALGRRDSAIDLLRDADIALYEAKASGKDQFAVFEPGMQNAIQDRLQLQLDLQSALGNDELFVLYQPTFNLRELSITGAEALVRWRHPTRGVVMPDVFIPIAEESGLIVDIGKFVLDRACHEAAAWHRMGYGTTIAVNVSARQLEAPDFVEDVRATLGRAQLSPPMLTLEITEYTLLRDSTIGPLHALKDLGVRIAVDDFGTGFSSLSYLSRFPIDLLKIDRSFISRDMAAANGDPIVHSIISLAKALGLETFAEGIETEEQLAYLRSEDCDNGQGFLFARPLEPRAILRFFSRSGLLPGVGSDRSKEPV